ncbi:inner membrane protein YhjD [Longispora fulva]|uniref:Membrane protein n=1 Tax=Longispora fulva TaxID=619741 RepID=A0A8J7KJG6_9ACTN|nr:YhjD/YihY/BrkB family envelope integrity protein [Longispora fulva]MBG6136879.1 membrane protein [Longispora fulva]GIG60050.1 inner membrane protein YhjD [Longispora fulva]
MRWWIQLHGHGRVRHLVRALGRYSDTSAGLLAAGVTYYSFFAVLALTVFGLAMAGVLFGDVPQVRDAVREFVVANLPRVQVDGLLAASGRVGAIAMAGFVLAGLWWVESTRSSIRAIWRLPRDPGSIPVRYALDLAVLAGLGVLLAVSLGVQFGTNALLRALVPHAAGWASAGLAVILGVAVNAVLAAALLVGVPRLRMTPGRVAGPALIVAVGLEGLKTVGRLYVGATVANPAYQVMAGSVGLLVFLYLLNQLLFLAAALTATSDTGAVYDLGCRRRARAEVSAARS